MMNSHLAISPCCNPSFSLDEALKQYSAIGFAQFELFTSWAASAVDMAALPGDYVNLGKRC